MFTLTQLDRDAIFHMPFGLPLEDGSRACIICNLPWPCPSRPDVKNGDES